MTDPKRERISVRLLESGDDEAVSAIFAHATEELRKVYRKKASANPKTGGPSERWIAAQAGRVVGVVEVCRGSNEWYLQGLAVIPDHRSQGIARTLVDHLTRQARYSGASRVRLSTIKETGNVTVFQRLGFAVAAESKSEVFQSVHGGEVTQVDMYRGVD